MPLKPRRAAFWNAVPPHDANQIINHPDRNRLRKYVIRHPLYRLSDRQRARVRGVCRGNNALISRYSGERIRRHSARLEDVRLPSRGHLEIPFHSRRQFIQPRAPGPGRRTSAEQPRQHRAAADGDRAFRCRPRLLRGLQHALGDGSASRAICADARGRAQHRHPAPCIAHNLAARKQCGPVEHARRKCRAHADKARSR